MKVTNVNNNEVTFQNWAIGVEVGNTAGSTLFIEQLNANDYIGLWIKEIIEPYTQIQDNPPNNFVLGVWYE